MGDVGRGLLGGGSEAWLGPRLEAESGFLLPLAHLRRGTAPGCVGFLFFFFSSNPRHPVAFHNVEEIGWPPHQAAVCEAPGTCLEAMLVRKESHAPHPQPPCRAAQSWDQG